MNTILFCLVFVGVWSPCHQFLTDETPLCQNNCNGLEQQLVDCQDKVRILEDEIKTLKQLSASTCHCHDGWIHGNGSCYYMPNQKATWLTARTICQQLGGHLASITSAGEEKIIADIIYSRAYNTSAGYEGVSYVWLGGSDTVHEGHWQWVTGEPFKYTNWRVTNQHDYEDCLDWSYGGWNDNKCTTQYYFLCEM